MSVFEGINYFCHDMLMLAPAIVVNKYILFYSMNLLFMVIPKMFLKNLDKTLNFIVKSKELWRRQSPSYKECCDFCSF